MRSPAPPAVRMRLAHARSRERMAGAAPGAIMDEDYFGSAAEWGDEADGGQVRGGAGRPRRGLLVSVAGGPAPPPPRPAPRSPYGSSTACPAPSPPRSAPPAPAERPPPAFAPGPTGPAQSAAALRCRRVGAGAGPGGVSSSGSGPRRCWPPGRDPRGQPQCQVPLLPSPRGGWGTKSKDWAQSPKFEQLKSLKNSKSAS